MQIDERFSSVYLRQFFKGLPPTTVLHHTQHQAHLIPHVELNIGGYYIQGGMHLSKTIRGACKQIGVQIHTNTDVRRILVDAAEPEKMRG